MGYRDLPARERAEKVGDVLLLVDASGRAGAPGADGHHGASGMAAGMNGSPGGPAGAASPGEPGGVVACTLSSEGSSLARVAGERRLADGRGEAIDALVEIGEEGFIDLVARGGAGGRGGRGGRGGDGARGHRGRDATRYSSGGNGGGGGDGGRGGNGTSGAAGAPGGHVVVRVDEHETHLLMLVRQGVEGGPGGAAGVHGAGGSGGPGGPGGSSHSWTESESYTDAQGHHRTRTTHHSNPGGHSGPSGMTGPSGQGTLAPGPSGTSGDFAIEVRRAGGVARYPSRYHLVLSAIALSTDDRDGVFEPGEKVRVDRIRVRNVGGMPSPAHHPITLEVSDSAWCYALSGERLELPRSIAAGAEAEVAGRLTFELRDHAPSAASDPLTARERVSLRCAVPDVRRAFDRFEGDDTARTATMLVRFPIACSMIEGLVALAPGEASRFRFAIRNQSQRPLGAGSEQRRIVRARVALHDSELGDESAVLLDAAGRTLPLAGHGSTIEIARLGPGEDWIFEGTIAIRPDAPTYRELRLRLTLELGRLDMPDVAREVQHREHAVRVVRPLAPGASMDWLLVGHHNTTREEIDAWEALAARLGRRMAVWDLSLQGHLELEAPRDDGPPLLDRLGGGLVIVLDYPLTTARGEARPHGFLSPRTIAAAAARNVDVLIAGGTLELDALLAPEPLETDAAPMRGERALLERMAARRDELDGLAFTLDAELHEIGFFFEQRSELRLEARAQRLAEAIAVRFPERRCVVVHDFAPGESRSYGGLFAGSRLGRVRVLARPAGRSGIAHLAAADSRVATAEFPSTAECRRALMIACGCDDRIDALARMIAAGELALAREWSEAVLVALASEQLAALRRTGARAGLSQDGLRSGLAHLARLARTPMLGAHDPGTGAGAVIADLAAHVLWFADAHASLWERVPPISFFRRAPALDAITEELVDRFLAVQSSDEGVVRALRSQVRASWKALSRRHREDRGGLWGSLVASGGPAAWARALLLAPVEAHGLTSSEELLVGDAAAAIAAPDWNGRLTKMRAGEMVRRELVASGDEERNRLLVPSPWSTR